MSISKKSRLPILVAAGWLSYDTRFSIAQGASPSSPLGIWRGESKCLTDAPACHDERVVYYIEADPKTATQVTVRADKIVDGKAITMGVGPWNYHSNRQALSFETNGQVWLLTFRGDQMEGTLTLSDKVVFRRMTLTRDPGQQH